MTSAAENEATIRRFYEAFQKKDAETMGAQYTDDATFSDPVFADLNAQEVRAMWTMLCHRGKDLTLTFKDVTATETFGSAIWDARYTFQGKRLVNNHIQARFTFRDGKIATHVDDFDLKKWMKMALGPMGSVMSLFAFGRNAVGKN